MNGKITEGTMKEKKEFEGVLTLDGDDGYCFGIHMGFQYDVTHDSAYEVIEYLDNLSIKHKGKKAKITIMVEIEE